MLLKQKAAVEAQVRDYFKLAMSGDSQAYERFLTLVSAMVKSYLNFLSKCQLSTDLLEDLQQEVLFSIHQKKHTYQLDRPILPWIYAITRHRFIDFYRARKRLPDLVEFEESYVTESDVPTFNLEELLSTLTQEQRHLLVLVKVEGASYEEASQELKVSAMTLKTRVHRMLKSIRKNYEDS